jgi:hypothetical protein
LVITDMSDDKLKEVKSPPEIIEIKSPLYSSDESQELDQIETPKSEKVADSKEKLASDRASNPF